MVMAFMAILSPIMLISVIRKGVYIIEAQLNLTYAYKKMMLLRTIKSFNTCSIRNKIKR